MLNSYDYKKYAILYVDDEEMSLKNSVAPLAMNFGFSPP